MKEGGKPREGRRDEGPGVGVMGEGPRAKDCRPPPETWKGKKQVPSPPTSPRGPPCNTILAREAADSRHAAKALCSGSLRAHVQLLL